MVVMVLFAVWTGQAGAQHSPYADQTGRTVKALSDQEIVDYESGKGMGYAKAAELNGYPGPAHVLELATELRLSPDQLTRTQQLFKSMQSDAVAIGRTLVDRERQLDGSFAAKTITPESLRLAMNDIASLQGQLREIHLKAHLAQSDILTMEQIVKYDELRGYSQPGTATTHRHQGH